MAMESVTTSCQASEDYEVVDVSDDKGVEGNEKEEVEVVLVYMRRVDGGAPNGVEGKVMDRDWNRFSDVLDTILMEIWIC